MLDYCQVCVTVRLQNQLPDGFKVVFGQSEARDVDQELRIINESDANDFVVQICQDCEFQMIGS
jgi:hypothetical protein